MSDVVHIEGIAIPESVKVRNGIHVSAQKWTGGDVLASLRFGEEPKAVF
jgi:hypothetical protein